MATLSLPRHVFIGFADYGRHGVGTVGDFTNNILDAAEALANSNADRTDTGRVIRIDFDDLGALIGAADVTADAAAITAGWAEAAE